MYDLINQLGVGYCWGRKGEQVARCAAMLTNHHWQSSGNEMPDEREGRWMPHLRQLGQVSFVPVLVAARLCAEGVKATLFAVLMLIILKSKPGSTAHAADMQSWLCQVSKRSGRVPSTWRVECVVQQGRLATVSQSLGNQLEL
jgi:hypothetical protein